MNSPNSTNISNPVFLLATERSGSNLIRAMIGSHSQVHAPSPPNLLFYFWPLEFAYGDLEKDENFIELVSDMLKYVNIKFSGWNLNTTPEELIKYGKNRSLLGAVDLLYAFHAKQEGKKWVFFKEIFMHNYAFQISNYYQNAKFIFLVRDGRDAVLSASKSSNHLYTAEEFATRWHDEQLKYLELVKDPAFKNKIHIVHYEDLISDPPQSLNDICNFLGLSFETNMTEYHSKLQFANESSKVQNWKNISKPVLSQNFSKYKKGFSSSKLKTIESIIYKPLILSGYPIEHKVEELSKINKKRIRKNKIIGLMNKLLRGNKFNFKEIKTRKSTVDYILSLENKLDQKYHPITQAKVFKKS